MTDERWRRVKAVFQAALERPAEERASFLAAETGSDIALHRDVESLLESDAVDGGVLEQLPIASDGVWSEVLSSSSPPIDLSPALPSLRAGDRIGSYQIVALVGVGAMGEVYQATDTKLNRDVALKVLPAPFSLDVDRVARFEREARLLAALNHPNIAAIYGLEESDGRQALVLELIEGPTLGERLGRGAIPIDESLAIARQIAGAMEAAHDKGIIHRDLKPANIKITHSGVVKVLDFGLARVWDGAAQSPLSASPSLTTIDLGQRAILGTPAYMSPEQARGQPLDKRSDIWSFGCLLHEMLAGRAPFGGETVSDTLAAILEREPEGSRLPRATPPSILTLLRRCLEKDRERRLDSAIAARLEIDDALKAPTAAGRRGPRPYSAWAVSLVLLGVALIGGVALWRRTPSADSLPMPPSRFAVVAAPGLPLNASGIARDIAFSPDGRRLVYRAGGTNSTGSPLMVRQLDQLDAQPVPGITLAYAPFFSPDGRWIGFFEGAELKKVSVEGGPAITLCQVAGQPLGASWGDDNSVVFATDDRSSGLWRVSADGGEPHIVSTVDVSQFQHDHQFPSFLPGGASVLFTIARDAPDEPDVAVLDLKTGRSQTLTRGSQAEYVKAPGDPAAPGFVIYARLGVLNAVRFDPTRLETVGDAHALIERPVVKASGAANYALSRAGTLVYMAGTPEQASRRELVWVERNGREESLGAPQRPYSAPRISPDGTRIAVGIYNENSDIWIWDLAHETFKQLTFDPAIEGMSVWTPDGRRIIFMSTRSGVSNVYEHAADGTGETKPVATSATPQWPTSIMADGSWLVGFDQLPRTDSNVVFFPMKRAGAQGGSAPPPFKGDFAEFSPSGRYLAYSASDSGRYEVYVRPFPYVDRGLWQVSNSGATRPAWARNGRELFYLDGSNRLTKVDVETTGPTFTMGHPVRVLDIGYVEPNPSRHYDVSADGRRFLMLKEGSAGDDAASASIVVVLNWFGTLQASVSEPAR